MQIEVVDAQENALGVTDFAMTSNNAGVTVVEDTAFNNIYDAAGNAVRPSPWTRARFEVTGTAFVSTTLTASGGGVTVDIPVRVLPAANLAVGISNLTPPLGDTLTITAAPGTHFTDSSTVSFAGGPAPVLVSIDPAGAFMLVLPGPSTSGQATITNVQVNFDPSFVFTVNSVDEVINDVAPADLGDPFSTTTPTLGQSVTVTAPTGYVFQTSSTVTFPGAAAPVITGLSADSTQLFLLVAPNTDTTVTVTNVIHERLPQFPLSLFSTAVMTSPVISNVPVTFSNATPPGAQVIRVTAGAGFQFDAASDVSGVFFAAVDPAGTWIDVVPAPGFSGTFTISGVIATAAPQFLLDLPTSSGLTVGNGSFTPSLAGTDQFATAPTPVTLPAPGSGASVRFFDAGPFLGSDPVLGSPDRIYRFDVAATSTITFNQDWDNAADLDFVYEDNRGRTVRNDSVCYRQPA